MKYRIITGFVALTLFLFTACDSTELPEDVLPERFSISIPNSMSNPAEKREDIQALSGDDIYEFMRVFIYVGESSADIVSEIMNVLRANHINQAMEFDYTSEDDNRKKHCVVTEQVEFNGVNYSYKLEITDAGVKALQIFWNNEPVSGVAILKPSVLNINDNDNPDAVMMIEYSETGENYTQEMTVSISGLNLDVKPLNNLKMYVGKTGDIVYVKGNANLPNITIADTNHTGGYQWVFVAKGDETNDIAAAELALPPCNYTSAETLSPFALKTVLTAEINTVYPEATAEQIALYLENTDAPGYFESSGFVSCGTNIPSNPAFSETFLDMQDMTPFIPKTVNDLNLMFAN